jgi:outer membrane protein assembly factor BamD
MKKNFRTILTIFSISLLLFSCAKKKEEKENAEIAYTKAMKSLKDKNYSSAAEAFAKIDDDFPFSKWAIKAQTMAVYAYYKDEDHAKLVSTVDDFIRLNPANDAVPYMMYMKGLSFYNQIPEINRAQDNTHEASMTFRELIARFPADEHSINARNKLAYVDDHLAGAKMSIGRYQMTNKNYVGAIHNFTEVTERYRGTNQVPEAFYRLTEVYYKIGLQKESVAAFRLLKSYFPQNSWVETAEKIDPVLFNDK